ncbi:MAG: hypothetical protein OXC82_07750 [Rhodobacteraceae bacterium]|nr:hypothetical protein [Paracoccaceae bacterium]
MPPAVCKFLPVAPYPPQQGQFINVSVSTNGPVLAVAPVPVEGRQEDPPGPSDTGRASAFALHR